MQNSQTATNNIELKTLSEIIDFAIGGDWGKDTSFNSGEYTEVGVIRGKEFTNWDQLKVSNPAIRRIKQSSLEKRKLQSGDLVIEISGGGPTQPVGRVVIIDDAVINTSNIPLVCSNFFRLIRLNEKVNPLYIKFALDYVYQSGEVTKYQTGSTNLRNLSFTKYVDEVTIPIPNKQEQELVAETIKNWSVLNLEAKNSLLKAKHYLQKFRRSVLSAAVTGKLTEEWRRKYEVKASAIDFIKQLQKQFTKVVPVDKYEELETLPSWVECKVKNLFSVQTGSTPYRKNDGYYLNGTIPWVKTGEVQNCDIYSAGEKITPLAIKETNTKTFPINTILIAMYGEGKTRGQVGRLKIEAATNQACAALVNPSIPDFFNEYAYIYCLSQYSQLRQEAVGGNQPNLNLSKIKEWTVSVPPEDEQREIVNRVKKMFEYADLVEKQIKIAGNNADKLTQSILAKAFRGEL